MPVGQNCPPIDFFWQGCCIHLPQPEEYDSTLRTKASFEVEGFPLCFMSFTTLWHSFLTLGLEHAEMETGAEGTS